MHVIPVVDLPDDVVRMALEMAEASAGEMTQPVNLTLARLLEDLGDLDGAHAAARRQIFLPGADRYATTLLQEQGRLALRLGRRDDAERAWIRYLACHDDPDPGPAADAAERVRSELARLRVEGR